MAGSLSLWGAGEMLRTFVSQSATPPLTFYLALIGDIPPNPYMSGEEISEPDAASYVRVELPNNVGYWSADVQPQLLVTAQDITFTEAAEDWGTIRYWALCDSPHGGNVYFLGKLEAAQVIKTGDSAQVGAGDLAVTLGPFFAVEAS